MKTVDPCIEAIQAELARLADRRIAAHSQRFFKTGPGQYGAGDRFRGIRVPAIRKLARKHRRLKMSQTVELLQSPWHEDRLLALLILVQHYQRADAATRKQIYHIYLAHTEHINNWDLVDTTAQHILGDYLADKDKTPLYRLAKSANLWQRRMAVMATFHYVKKHRYTDTLRIAELLLQDDHDLIHKAVGWMLREIGKRNIEVEASFLERHYRQMPRTMLRYAIEKFPKARRQAYLKGRVTQSKSKTW